MRLEKRGSILLWSIFFVVFITFSFLYISNGITKGIEKNKQRIEKISGALQVDTVSQNNKNIALNETELYSTLYYSSFEGSLKKDEKLTFPIVGDNTGSLEIISGGPVYYKTQNAQGILTGSVDSVPLSTSLEIENLGGIAQINIAFATASGITFPYNYFKRIKKIGGIEIIKETGLIQ